MGGYHFMGGGAIMGKTHNLFVLARHSLLVEVGNFVDAIEVPNGRGRYRVKEILISER